ncbi:SUR7/PalI family-domain-containing protein [Vararia minispora EC-137]|uniref:SUR7/PalI family-domain-containing protein n=1 Tax=Vararia minispora EC-137 TaxID=1314806 RepID=A0ACB8Q8V6_9AGAM|nr:SUR7/PalI family-domain-containing protein [Vararia minispora EC-137]
MAIIRPATPGFLFTLTATILLAVVSFNVPLIKSIYFLKAGISSGGISGNITFGTLGYCTDLPGNTTCTSARVGYELDINSLVGNNSRLQIPQVVVKWITYALVLHIVAFVLAAGAALFGLLAHVREFSMSCMSSCVSGIGAVIALVAFIFDLAFFFIARSRINSVSGGHAEIGSAVWLTLAAWLLLFFSGCFYCIGRCCINRRPRDTLPKHSDRTGSGWLPAGAGGNNYDEQMRLDAIKAEADRKARAQRGEVGLPAFTEYDPTQPLTTHVEDDDSQYVPHRNGYAQAAPGTRAVDDYYSPAGAAQNSYPPQPRRQGTQHSGHSTQPSTYPATTYVDADALVPLGGTPSHLSTKNSNVYLAAGQASQRATPSQHSQYGSQASDFNHTQQPSNIAYGQAVTHDYPYYSQHNQPTTAFNSDLYNNTAQIYPTPAPAPAAGGSRSPPQRHYTLGGGGYGDNVVPNLHDDHSTGVPLPYPSANATSPMGPRSQPVPEPHYEDQPPVYDDGAALPPGVWGAKGGNR